MSRVTGAISLFVLALALAACSGARSAEPRRVCLDRAAWQRLANRIHAPVYCPGWMPDPLDGVIGGRWNTIRSVSRNRSYLMGFIWMERGSGELHVNLRGYPGRTAIPRCPAEVGNTTVPCFADPHGTRHLNGIDATVYTVNQGADQWHVLYAWRRNGSLYALSQHVAPPLTYKKVVADLDRMLRSLVRIEPKG